MRKKNPLTRQRTYEQGFSNGVICAADVAADFDDLSAHTYRISDVVLCKLNQTRRKFPRRNLMADVAWTRGFALALAEVQRAAGCDSVTKRVLRNAGLTVKKLRAAGVEDYDIKPIAATVKGKHR